MRIRAWMWEHPFASAIFFVLAFIFVVLPMLRGNGEALFGGVVFMIIVIGVTVGVQQNRERIRQEDSPQHWQVTSTEDQEPIRMTDPSNERRRAAAIAAGTYVKNYRNREEFQRHAAELAADNWTVASVVERKPNAGCLRIALLWWLVLIFPPKPELLVTYQYNDPNKARPEISFRVNKTKTATDEVTQQACFNCGAIISIKHKFCPNCGAPLGVRPQPPTQQAIPAESSDDVVDVEFEQRDQ